ncbi:MAG: hypothetical protein ABIQ51_05140 [Mesorhizobium sp.]
MRLFWFTKPGKASRGLPPGDIYHTEIIADIAVPERAETVRFFSRKPVRTSGDRRISSKDLRETLLLAFYLAVAALLPVRWWAPVCNWMSGLRLKRHMRKDFPRYAAATRATLGQDVDAEGLFRRLLAAGHRRRLQPIAHLVSSRWSPSIRLEGLQGLQEALLRGRGAIIWCDQFTAQTVMGKRALHEAGIEAHQVSVRNHGVSSTGFGARLLNLPMVNVENRFLKSRLVFDRNDAYQVTARMQKILKSNGVVLMTNNIHAGSTFTEVAIGESGWAQLASAPANFAARNGTALFAMSTFETAPFREYLAMISPELAPTPAGEATIPVKDGAKNMALQARYILLKRDRLLEAAKLYPEQLMTWFAGHRMSEQADSIAPDDDTAS